LFVYTCIYRQFAYAKTDTKNAILTRACRLTVAGLLSVFVVHGAGIRRATRLSFRIFVKGGGANVTIVELRGGEDTSSVFSSAKCLLNWAVWGCSPRKFFIFSTSETVSGGF
jgi:hypothetical protein